MESDKPENVKPGDDITETTADGREWRAGSSLFVLVSNLLANTQMRPLPNG